MVESTMMVAVGGADQREVPFIGNGEEYAVIGKLEEISEVMIEQTRHDDVRSTDKAHMSIRGLIRAGEQGKDRWAGGLHDDPPPETHSLASREQGGGGTLVPFPVRLPTLGASGRPGGPRPCQPRPP